MINAACDCIHGGLLRGGVEADGETNFVLAIVEERVVDHPGQSARNVELMRPRALLRHAGAVSGSEQRKEGQTDVEVGARCGGRRLALGAVRCVLRFPHLNL